MEGKNPGRKYLDFVSKWTGVRENWLRYAAFLRAMEKIDKGDTFYWASNTQEIDPISDKYEKAGKLAREALLDYGNLSEAGQYIRRKLEPFYSWTELNLRRYIRLLKNASSPKVQARVTASFLGRSAASTAIKILKAHALMHVMSAAVVAYNRAFFKEENDKLNPIDSKGLQLIVGTDNTGKPITIPIVGALYDAADFFGITGVQEYFDNWMTGSDGKTEFKKAANQMALAPPSKLI